MESPRQQLLGLTEKIPKENYNPSDDQIMEWIDEKIVENNRDLVIFHSKITSRSAAFTDVIGDGSDDTGKYAELANLFEFVNPQNLIVMTLKIGQNNDIALKTTAILPKQFANKAYMLRRNFYHSDHEIAESDIISFDIPHYPKRRVIVDPTERVTYVMGIDYYGEQKMSHLRMAMEIMRRENGSLGLHAGAKTYHLKTNGMVEKKGAIIFGLSGTGKTTLTTHNHNLEGPESVDILQDDIVFISGDGEVYGSEYGFYVKCSDVPSHKTITKAVHTEGSVLENVWVNSDGEVEFQNFNYTHNSRAIIPRANMDGAASDIDLPSLNLVIYNTRRPELPPIGRLTSPAQAAAFYGLGESIITSAEDPARAGEAKRVVGFDPFVLGDHSININRMKSIFDNKSGVEVLVLNTGYVGEESNNIRVEDTLACIEGALRGTIEWELDPDLHYEVPKKIDGVDLDRLNPRKYYGEEEYTQLMTKLREDRIAYLSQFEAINEDILNSV